MFGAPSIVPEVGSKLCLPRFHPATACRKLTASPSFVEPGDYRKRRPKVPSLYPYACPPSSPNCGALEG